MMTVLCLLWAGTTARADLVLGLVGDLTWNKVDQPGGPPPILFTVGQDNLAINGNQLNAFSIGLKIVPFGTATGSIFLQSASVPVSNAVFPAYGLLEPKVAQTEGFTTITAGNLDGNNVLVPNTGRNLFTANFASPGNNAIGRFDIFAEPLLTSYFIADPASEGFSFGNVAAGQNGVYLGSITASITAVPEPSSIVFGLSAAGMLGWAYRRKITRMTKPRDV